MVNVISSDALLHLLLLHVSEANPKVRAVVAKCVADTVDKALKERQPGVRVSLLYSQNVIPSFDTLFLHCTRCFSALLVLDFFVLCEGTFHFLCWFPTERPRERERE